MKLRVGLIGLGDSWQTRYAPALRAISDRYEVRAVCDQVAHLAAQAARDFDASKVDGFRALVQREDVDAVLMLAPQWFGPLPIFAACDAGKAVYSAVVLDLDLATAARLKQRVDAAGVAFMTELPKRHAPATLRLKELMATRLGRPRLIFCHRRQPADRSREPRPAMQDLVELVDWCRFIVGEEPTSVVGIVHPADTAPQHNEYEMLSLHFPVPTEAGDGVTAQISCGQYLLPTWPEASTFRPPAAMQIACERGVAFVDLPATIIWFDEAGRHHESLDSDRPVGEQMLLQFFRAVTSLVRRTSDLEDAYRSMAIVLAARQSQEEERRMPLAF
jgi:predicted dehydrogenase